MAQPADMPMPPPNAVDIRPADPAAVEIGIRGIEALQRGAAAGDWSDMLALLAEDVTFYAPVDGFAGLQEGVDRARTLFEHHAKFTRTTLTLGRVVANGNEVGFELRAEGRIDGFEGEYANNLFMLFVVVDGRIAQFREYEAGLGGWTGWEIGRGAFEAADALR